MNKKHRYTLPLLLALLVAFGMFVGFKFHSTYKTTANGNSDKLFDEVLKDIDEAYVDAPDHKKLMESAISGMLKELDPHSVFIPADEVKQANEDLEGNFEGVGIEFNILNDTIIVISAISGGPSEQVGIRAGDRIINIDDKKVAGVGFKNEDVFKSLRGPKGTRVKVRILRPSDGKKTDLVITRGKIPLYSIDAAYMIRPGIGYIRINRFGATTIDEYNTAFGKLRREGMQSLILDLRSNPGGYLKAAIQLADEFLPQGDMIVYTQGRSRSKEVYKASDIGGFEAGKLAVLIDEGSASASEIVTGALQDWDRAIVVGRRSFGKGLVQEPFMLSDGSNLRLTVARYYTPSGRSIQKPYTNGYDDYEEDLNRRVTHGELYSKDSIKMVDSLKFYTHEKRLVYGGGGIMPDIFVPADTAENSVYLLKLLNKGLFTDFVTDYMDRHRAELSSYNTFEDFNKGFKVNDAILNSFVAAGEKEGVKKDPKGLAVSAPFMRAQIKALMARQLFHSDGYYEVINETSKPVLEALKALQGNTLDQMHIDYK